MKKQIRQTFTLVEVIAVIVILGILAATVVPKLGNVTDQAEEAMIQACVNQLNSRASVVWATETLGGTKAAVADDQLAAVIGGADKDTPDSNLFGDDFLLGGSSTGYTVTIDDGDATTTTDPVYNLTYSAASDSDPVKWDVGTKVP